MAQRSNATATKQDPQHNAENIRQHGVLQPILVRPLPKGAAGTYELVAGGTSLPRFETRTPREHSRDRARVERCAGTGATGRRVIFSSRQCRAFLAWRIPVLPSLARICRQKVRKVLIFFPRYVQDGRYPQYCTIITVELTGSRVAMEALVCVASCAAIPKGMVVEVCRAKKGCLEDESL